jgi:hypothetical protein
MGARKEERKIIILKSMDEFGLKLSLSSFIDFRVFNPTKHFFLCLVLLLVLYIRPEGVL